MLTTPAEQLYLLRMWLLLGPTASGRAHCSTRARVVPSPLDEIAEQNWQEGQGVFLVTAQWPARFKVGWVPCTPGALDVGVNVPRVDSRM